MQDGSFVSWTWFSLALVLFAIEADLPDRLIPLNYDENPLITIVERVGEPNPVLPQSYRSL